MNFSSPLFLFAFLPVTMLAYFLAGRKTRPWVFTTASLFFCLWAGPLLFPVIILSTLVNFLIGQSLISVAGKSNRGILWAGIVFNIILMLGFKILVAYGPSWVDAADSLSRYAPYLIKGIALPVGISFYSFQAIAYLVDIHANRIKPETRLQVFTEYMTAFPKVVAGPITRYRDLNLHLGIRQVDWDLAGAGARRFVLGLAKKTIIADRLSLVVDSGVFDQAFPILSTPAAWFVLICYAFQIYFDFSGYTDMAIGLGMIFGLQFPENFNFPYQSKSISEFWRRWHMTLSGWFREMVFYPLERKRAGGVIWLNQYTNVLIVFLLTGLWHGVTINFLIWGLLHGMAICMEVSPAGKILRKFPAVLQHLYALVIVLSGWVFFRSNSPLFAITYLKTLVGLAQPVSATAYSILTPPTLSLWLTLALALVFSFPTLKWLKRKLHLEINGSVEWVNIGVSLVLLGISLVILAGSTFQPYIYGNF